VNSNWLKLSIGCLCCAQNGTFCFGFINKTEKHKMKIVLYGSVFASVTFKIHGFPIVCCLLPMDITINIRDSHGYNADFIKFISLNCIPILC